MGHASPIPDIPVACEEAYDLTVYSLERPSFSVSAKCKYGGCAVNVTACTGDGMPYILKGCSPGGAESNRVWGMFFAVFFVARCWVKVKLWGALMPRKSLTLR